MSQLVRTVQMCYFRHFVIHCTVDKGDKNRNVFYFVSQNLHN